MKGNNLGEFEELVLLMVGNLNGNAYGVPLAEAMLERTGRNATLSSIHTALYRLEEKGYVKSEMGGNSASRGGRKKRLYSITAEGHRALAQTREIRESLWKTLPDLGLG